MHVIIIILFDNEKELEWFSIRVFLTIGRSQGRDRVVVLKRPKFVYCWLGRVIITPCFGFY